MCKLLLFLFSLTAISSVYSADAPTQSAPAPAPAPIVFPNYGFRINPLDVGSVYPVVPAVQMYLPAVPLPSNRQVTFSPNVYAQVQPFVGTMKDYIDQSTKSMQDAGYIIRGQLSPSVDVWDLEYMAVVNGVGMHWYAKAIHSGYRIYYAAGGVPDEMWPQFADMIKSCVNSFDVTGTAPEIKLIPASTPVTAPPAAVPSAPPAPVPAATTTSAMKPAAPAAKSATGTSAK